MNVSLFPVTLYLSMVLNRSSTWLPEIFIDKDKERMNEEFHAAFEDAITSYVFIYPFLKESLRVRDVSLAY